jgi:hypothetical protein
VIWRDDKQVFSATVIKVYGDRPRLEIEVQPWQDPRIKEFYEGTPDLDLINRGVRSSAVTATQAALAK